MRIRLILFAGASLIAIPAAAQTADQPVQAPQPDQSAQQDAEAPVYAEPDDEYGDEDVIVVQGSKARGAALGDIPPEQVLDSRDVRATGATNISELLEALAPDIGSAQGRSGGRPILLLDGKKISGFRELRDIPTEAIERVEILPEEVGLKYGYGADQKVLNIVLRPRFRSTAATLTGNAATDGGYAGAAGDVTRLMINGNGRTSINAHAEGNGMLTEDERDIIVSSLPPGADLDEALAARSLIGSKRLLRGSATLNRTILGDVSATFNAEAEHNEGRSLIGLGTTSLEALGRKTRADSGHLGFALNGAKSGWQWSLIGNGDVGDGRTRTGRDDPTFGDDVARERVISGDLTATANGRLFKLPAGEAGATVTLAGDTVHLHSETDRLGLTQDQSLGRTTERAAVNVDLPISRRNRDFSALGNLTLSANAEAHHFSDFGTLTKIGASASSSPVERFNFIASWSREEGAPSINQLGDPVLETPDARIFDFTTGETVLATAITGGNPDLEADRRTVTKLGANWQPLEKINLRLRADYVRSRIDRPVSNIFGPTPALEAAFPDRFVRDSSGQLVSADLRPINFDKAEKDTLRVGFSFSKPLKSRRPSQSVMDQIRAQFRGAGGERRGNRAEAPPQPAPAGESPPPRMAEGDAPPPPPADGASQPPPPSNAGPPPEGGRGFGGRGGGGGGGFFGGGSRGRLTFSLADEITLKDQVSIAPGQPVLDYLHGEASGVGGGTPRHKVEAQAGWANNGFGARIGANWQSGTRVQSRAGEDLRFSPLATFDLRFFANLGDQPELVLKHPFLRGSSLRIEVKNVLDEKPKVRDPSGAVPINYQADLLDPLGRTVMVTFRKLFLPSRAAMRRNFERDRGDSR